MKKLASILFSDKIPFIVITSNLAYAILCAGTDIHYSTYVDQLSTSLLIFWFGGCSYKLFSQDKYFRSHLALQKLMPIIIDEYNDFKDFATPDYKRAMEEAIEASGITQPSTPSTH